ncbi:MAG: hypothetical protein ACRC1Z_25105, partial [Waterburya sp.]
MFWGLELIASEFSHLGLSVPIDLECRLKRLVDSEHIDNILDQGVSSLAVARTWKSVLNSKENDRLAWIGLLLILRKHFNSSDSSLHQALYENFGLGRLGSRIQLELRLGGFLFDEARGSIKQSNQRKYARRLFEEAIQSFNFLEQHDEKVKQKQKLTYRGKRGVCHLMLARGITRGDTSSAVYAQQLKDA